MAETYPVWAAHYHHVYYSQVQRTAGNSDEATFSVMAPKNHLAGFGISPNPLSPNREWLAVQSRVGEVSVLRPDGADEHKIFTISGDNIYVQGFIGSQHLLVTEHTVDRKTNRDGVNYSLISIKEGTILPINFPGINLEDFIVDSLFWQAGMR